MVVCCTPLNVPQVGKMADAMRVALRINDVSLIESTLAGCFDPLEQQQLGYMLARQVRLCV